MWLRFVKLCFGVADQGEFGYLPQRLRARHSALLHYSRQR